MKIDITCSFEFDELPQEYDDFLKGRIYGLLKSSQINLLEKIGDVKFKSFEGISNSKEFKEQLLKNLSIDEMLIERLLENLKIKISQK